MNKFIKSKLTAIEQYVNRTYIIGHYFIEIDLIYSNVGYNTPKNIEGN